MSERSLEIRVGALVLVALVVLVAFIVALGDFTLFAERWPLKVRFGYTGNVPSGAPVKISGVQVGKVDQVRFLGAGVRDSTGHPLLVELELSLQPRAQEVLTTDAEFFVSTQGLLGEPYVEIVPGRIEGTPLEPGAVVRGVDPPRLELLFARVSGLLENITGAVAENEAAVQDLIQAGGGIAKHLEGLLADNRDDIRVALGNTATASADLQRIAADVAGQLEAGGDAQVLIEQARESMAILRRDLPGIMDDVRTTTARLEELSKMAEGVGPEDLGRIRDAIAHYEKVGERLAGITADVEQMVNRVERGGGTLGGLLQDDQIYEDMKELLRDIKEHPWKILWKD